MLGCDIFVNVAGGIDISEPAADLAVSLALASSLSGRPIDGRTVVFGEVGLAGELRAIAQADLRLAEAHKLGFTRAVLPEASRARASAPAGMKVIGARSIADALEALMG